MPWHPGSTPTCDRPRRCGQQLQLHWKARRGHGPSADWRRTSAEDEDKGPLGSDRRQCLRSALTMYERCRRIGDRRESTAAAWGVAGRTSALRKPEKVCSSVVGDTTASSACGTSSGADLCEARAGLEPCRTDRASVRFAAAATNVHILRKSYSRSVAKDVNVSTTSSSNISGGARVHWHFTLSLYLRRPRISSELDSSTHADQRNTKQAKAPIGAHRQSRGAARRYLNALPSFTTPERAVRVVEEVQSCA